MDFDFKKSTEFEWIEKMNAMFEANPYTTGKRVAIEYSSRCDVVVIRVMDDVCIIKPDGYTEYGLMCAIMCNVEELYGKRES